MACQDQTSAITCSSTAAQVPNVNPAPAPTPTPTTADQKEGAEQHQQPVPAQGESQPAPQASTAQCDEKDQQEGCCGGGACA